MDNLKYVFVLLVLTVCLSTFVSGDDDYKPYLHQPVVPESPEVKLFGQYNTNLFPGAATYNYPIQVPQGVNGLSPAVFLSYTSQSIQSGIVGAGWSLNSDMIYRDVNGTPDDTTDDSFVLILDSNSYQLVYSEGSYHTEVDYFFRIQNYSSYWIVTKQDGTQYRFGYNGDSELYSNSGRSYALKWFLDTVTDVHSNEIYYSYIQNLDVNDVGAVYIDKITYNSDLTRVVQFNYETDTQSKKVYEQGNLMVLNQRLSDVSVFSNSELVRRYHLDYVKLSPALSSLSSLSEIGSDNVSQRYSISFDYYLPQTGYLNTTQWRSPALLSDNVGDTGVRLVDLNNDGFIDVVQANSGISNESWINDKEGGWTNASNWKLPVSVVSGASYDEGVRFADVNNDGFTDIIQSKYGLSQIYENNGTGWIALSWSVPLQFVDSGANAQGVQLAELNGDGRIDFIQSKDGNRSVYLHNGTGWYDASWSVPEDFISSGTDTGLRLLDLNADGLTDLLLSSNYGVDKRKAWLNNGTGFSNNTAFIVPSGLDFVNTDVTETGVRFLDANNDGFVDILEDYFNDTVTEVGAWLNNGSGWIENSSWVSAERFSSEGKNVGRRIADVNGDGQVDMMVSHIDQGTGYVQLKNSSLPFLLKSITNAFGGVTTLNYTTSTQFNNTENNISQIGFNIFVVSNVTVNNSLTGDYGVVGLTAYNYSFGKYDYDNKEFRGFGLTTEIMPSSVVEHYFNQSDALRAKEYRTKVFDNNNSLMIVSETTYSVVENSGVYNVSLVSETDYRYEGFETPIVSNTSYAYNHFGNPAYVLDDPDVSITGDERVMNYTYAFNTNDWVIDKVARKTTYANGEKVSETSNYYDGLGLGAVTKGDLTKTESWLASGENIFSYNDYDSRGNLIRSTDALGNVMRYRYDASNTFVESVINPLGHIETYSYDLGTGNLLYSEENGIRTTFSYDVFGRQLNVIEPYDSTELPTSRTVYEFDGVAPEIINVSSRSIANVYDTQLYFYDGFGNVVQIKTEGDVVKNVFYDNEFRVVGEQIPYFDTFESSLSAVGSEGYTNYTYDSLGRVVAVTNPDGSYKEVGFALRNITAYDENRNKKRYFLDSRDRIATIHEYNVDPLTGRNETYITTYGYDDNDNLILITDNEGNVFEFVYDALGRKVSMNDPDMGTWTYSYDANGNLLNQTDNRNISITFVYDALNRVLEKISDNVNVSFTYDEEYKGTLSNYSVSNGLGLSKYLFSYDDRLRVVEEDHIFKYTTINFEHAYDSQDRLVSSDGFNFVFDSRGMVARVPNHLNASFLAFGGIANRTFTNGITTHFDYEASRKRLSSIVSSVQNLSYNYDPVGNILSINDSFSDKLYSMQYDALDRLVYTSINSDVYKYSYNSIGNMMKIIRNDVVKNYVYNGSQAHFPSQIINTTTSVDIHDLQELNTHAKNRVFEYFLVNDNATNLTTRTRFNFGDGNDVVVDINVSNTTLVFMEHEYSDGDTYDVSVSGNITSLVDYQQRSSMFGIDIVSLTLNSSNSSMYEFLLLVNNTINESILNVGVSCSEGYVTTLNVSAVSQVLHYFSVNYTDLDNSLMVCNVTSSDGDDSEILTFNLQGLEIENYDILVSNISSRVVAFDVVNYFSNLESEINITAGDSFSQNVTLSNGESVMVFTEVNYTTDGSQSYGIDVRSGSYLNSYVDSFLLQGVGIENYARVSPTHTRQIMLFDVVNNWHSGNLSFNISNLINESVNLDYNESIMVMIENNYTEQGFNTVEIQAQRAIYTPLLTDFFEIRPLWIQDFQTLSNDTVSLVVTSNIGVLDFDWQLDTTLENITNTLPLNVTNNTMVFIQSNYVSGVTPINIRVNNTNYNDTQDGVMLS